MNQATLVVHPSTLSPKALVEISLQGSWRLNAELPSLDSLGRQLAQQKPCKITLRPSDEFQWDSRFLAFLLSLQALSKQHQSQLDISLLPDEIQHLYQLANAVPEHKPVTSDKRSLLNKLAGLIRNEINELIEFLAFTGEIFLAFFRWTVGKGSARTSDIIAFCRRAGPEAIAIITLQSVLVGMILAYLGMIQLSKFGAEVYVSNLVAVGMVREMGALMTAVIMSGRTGAAYAAQLGTMQVNEEIDALATLGIKPVDYLVIPRMLALVICMPLLCLYSNIMGMLGGGLVATGMDVTWRMYIFQLLDTITVSDVATGVVKGLVFAKLIAIAGCRAGLACGRSSAAVGEATTRAVVTAIVYLVIADAGLNIIYFELGI